MVEKCVSNLHPSLSSTQTGVLDSGHHGGCFGQLRLGGSLLSRRTLPGGMVRSRMPFSHQQEGDHSRPQGYPGYDAQGRPCSASSRQHDSSSLYKQNGGYSVKSPLPGSHEPMAYCAVQTGVGQGNLGPKRRESVIGPVVQVCSSDLGVFPVSKCGNSTVDTLVSTSSGCLCQQPVSSSSGLLQLVQGSGSIGQRCFRCSTMAQQDLLFSSSSASLHDSHQDQGGQGHGHSDTARMENSPLVGHIVTNAVDRSLSIGVLQECSDSNRGSKVAIPPSSSSLSAQWQQDLPLLTDQARALVDHDIRSGTHKIYLSRFRIFSAYCAEKGFSPTDCPVEVVTNFLAMLKDTKHLSYQTICGYRSAISRYHKGYGSVPLGQAQLIKRVTKACFNLAPPLAKYSAMWDADQLMRHLQTMYPHSDLSMRDLGIKAVALITVLSISRHKI